MKTKEYNGPKPSRLTYDEWNKQILDLINQSSEINAFSINGRYFSGNRVNTIKAYLYESPSKPFIEWLIDNSLEIHN